MLSFAKVLRIIKHRQNAAPRKAATIIVLVASLALFWPTFQQRVHVRGDLGAFHLPTRAFYSSNLQAGEGFVWCPDLWSGFYLHGEGQVGMLHPLHVLLYGLLPLELAFGLEIVLNLPILFVGMFLLLKRWRIDANAAAFGALSLTLSGWMMRHYQHVNAIAVLSHLPWLLLAIDGALTRGPTRRAKDFIFIAMLTGSQLLLGYPQYVLFSLLVELMYISWRLGVAGRAAEAMRTLAHLGIAKLYGVAIGAAQLLPTWDALAHSVRASYSTSAALKGSLMPLNLAQHVAPYVFGGGALGSQHESAVYCGSATTVLMVWLLMRRKRLTPKHRRLASATIATFGIATVLAMGKYGLLQTALVHLPVMGSFRIPARYGSIVCFAAAVAAALAFADLARASRRQVIPWRRLWPFAALVSASAAVSLAAWWIRLEPARFRYLAPRIGTPAELVASMAMISVAAALLAAAARGRRGALLALVLFAGADLFIYGFADLSREPAVTIEEHVAGRPRPPRRTRHRIEAHDTALILDGWRLAGGYVGLLPESRLEGLDDLRPRVQGARWRYIARSPHQQAAPISHVSGSWRELDPVLPRARLVTTVRVLDSADLSVQTLDLERETWLDRRLDLPPGTPGRVHLLGERPGEIDIQTTADSRQLLVVSERWHPGWKALVDGKESALLRADGDFIGCVVEAGQHTVSLRFRPMSLRLGIWISIAGLGLTLLVFGPWRRRATPVDLPETRTK